MQDDEQPVRRAAFQMIVALVVYERALSRQMGREELPLHTRELIINKDGVHIQITRIEPLTIDEQGIAHFNFRDFNHENQSVPVESIYYMIIGYGPGTPLLMLLPRTGIAVDITNQRYWINERSHWQENLRHYREVHGHPNLILEPPL